MEKSCMTCKKSVRVNGKITKCKALTDCNYFWNKHNDCFAWTDDENWEKKFKEQIEAYEMRSMP